MGRVKWFLKKALTIIGVIIFISETALWGNEELLSHCLRTDRVDRCCVKLHGCCCSTQADFTEFLLSFADNRCVKCKPLDLEDIEQH